ncbi:MAG: hypothetical protein Q9221_006668 [Calogaya cf. arnoldii]
MTSQADEICDSKTCPAPIEIIEHIIALNDEHESASRFGSFSGTVYDTAWLSMITKVASERKDPLFPDCFDYLLKSQKDDGAWGDSASQLDAILNSLAGLLALATRQRWNSTDTVDTNPLDWRIKRAYSATQKLLQDWDPSQCVHVGFEILVPSLLRQLENFDIHFDFPGHSTLMYLHNQKLRKFDHSLVYSAKPTTLLHSLEAFVGLVDFDRVDHHCSEVSGIFGSPAATAAYLINVSTWDERAERYLRMVATATRTTGAVPSAYPTCIFEISWTLSTLLAPGLLPRQLTDVEKEKLRKLFETSLNKQGGTVGFAPGLLEDADDTARTLLTLQDLGKPASPERMIEKFQTNKHFRTYELEGSPSFSANCNVVLSLLGVNEINKYAHHIETALTFLLEAEESGTISDKWNLSPQYCRMLFMQTLLSVLKTHNDNCLESLSPTVIYEQVPGCICRLLSQTLSSQRSDGSWAGSLEVTAYSILTLAHCLSLPWSDDIRSQLNDSLLRGRQYLRTEYGTTDKRDYLWVEKVSYRSSLLHSTYCSAALNIAITEHRWSTALVGCFTLQKSVTKQMNKLISSLPLFKQSPLASVNLVLVEAGQVSKRLKRHRDMLFTRDDIPMTADKYVEFIPMIWVACNHKSGHVLSADVVWEMVLLSLLNYQVDEYMESVVGRIEEIDIPMLVAFLKQECDGESGASHAAGGVMTDDRDPISPAKKRKMNGGETRILQGSVPEQSTVSQAAKALSQFIQHVIQHGSLVRSPPPMQREMAKEVSKFLVAHITHNQDNVALAKSKGSGTEDGARVVDNGRTYIDWVRTIASDDTSCPFSFLFFTALISERGHDCFEGPQAGYLSRSLCRQLATMCRQYNDYGSAERDAAECNLNSLDFPEFQSFPSPAGRSCKANGSGGHKASITTAEKHEHESSDDKPQNSKRAGAKEDLMVIAEYERSCMQLTLGKLTAISPPATIQKLQVFIDVTDMFGQIYVQRDIASRLQGSSQ